MCRWMRLDVAADLGYNSEYNHRFWKKFRKAVKEAKSRGCYSLQNIMGFP